MQLRPKKLAWKYFKPADLAHTNLFALIAVVTLVMFVISIAAVVVRPPSVVVSSIVWVAPVIAIVATRVIPVISRVSVVAVPVRGVTKSDSNSSDAD